jgi:hypothetical protein
MIHGAHVIMYSKDAEADRAFFRDVLKYPSADAGHGWLIFALPPAEIAVHPSDENDVHELYLMCDDVQKLIAEMTGKGIATTAVHEERWGLLTQVTLPSGSKLGVYQPKHASPLHRRMAPKKRSAKRASPKKKAVAVTARKSDKRATKPKKRAR